MEYHPGFLRTSSVIPSSVGISVKVQDSVPIPLTALNLHDVVGVTVCRGQSK